MSSCKDVLCHLLWIGKKKVMVYKGDCRSILGVDKSLEIIIYNNNRIIKNENDKIIESKMCMWFKANIMMLDFIILKLVYLQL